MLQRDTRTAILELASRGVSVRRIARTLEVSRGAVRRVLRSGTAQVPRLDRTVVAESYDAEIRRLFTSCNGNRVRVHEELAALGATLSYPALTTYCREQGIGVEAPVPVGRYTFEPGEEVQHDTSPHRARIAGRLEKIQTAGAVLGYSRMVFHQCYPRFRRFECKLFLRDAGHYFDGVWSRCMVDNTSVVVLHGTGASAVIAPEMEAFAKRYGFTFVAHEKGDANRSARVERAFHHFENNFLVGREFDSFEELQRRAREWCDRKNATFKRHLKASPRDLFAREHPALKRLPLHDPEPYLLHQRTVDSRGFVSHETNRYSVPVEWIGRRIEVRETRDEVVLTLDRHPPIHHPQAKSRTAQTLILPEHRGQRRSRRPTGPGPELAQIAEKAPEIVPYAQALLDSKPKQPTIAMRTLLRMIREYPREPLLQALGRARRYGLFELFRVEKMILAAIRSDYFLLDDIPPDDPENDS